MDNPGALCLYRAVHYFPRYGAFVARSKITPERAVAFAEAGLQVLVIQVDYQGSPLTQRSSTRLRAETEAARAAGLEVWWWAWVRPDGKPKPGRPSGVRALRRRLEFLVRKLGEPPAGFFVNAEVGGGWSPGNPDLIAPAMAARAAGMPIVGLTSHGEIGPGWDAGAYDLGAPQLYRPGPMTLEWAQDCLASWKDAPYLWPVLGCSASSPADEMRSDLATAGELAIPGVLWWSATDLVKDDRLAAAVPAGAA